MLAHFVPVTPLDRGFAVLAISTAVLVSGSLAFALLAMTLRLGNDRSVRKRDRQRRKWEPATLEILSGAAPPEAIQERIDAREGLDFLSFLLAYAGRLRGEEQSLVRRMAQPYLPSVVHALGRGRAEARGHAVQILARMGMPTYAGPVAEALDDESPIVAMIAARCLFQPGQERYFPRVLAHLPRFAPWSRSFLAAMLAGGGAQTAPLLRTVLEDPGAEPVVRAVAADALRELNDLASVDVALRVLASETEREIVAGSLRILRKLGHRDHVSTVRSFVSSDDPVIRAAAAATLGAIGGPGEIPLLQDSLDDPSFWVSLECARGLLALGDIETLQRLAESGGPWATLARQVLSE